MTNEELQKKLTLLQTKLSKAHKENDIELIHKYVGELNDLWGKASVEMLKNAEADGIYPYKPLND
ncbi:hypothetical protein N9322_01615 [bacterium]|jgi:hypothetical protein|nr:hypothetical protein [bacterium]|tara:strand:- start:1432 stop:1626 length:195 start_codon:yes stop_codon:yes gene_type:complete